MLTLEQCAARTGLERDTFYHWICCANKDCPISEQAKDFVSRLTKVGKRTWRMSAVGLSAWLRRYPQRSGAAFPAKDISEEIDQLLDLSDRLQQKDKKEAAMAISGVADSLVSADSDRREEGQR